MIGYRSGLRYGFPTAPEPSTAMPAKYSGAGGDVYSGLMDSNLAKQRLAQEQGAAEYDAQYRDAQRNLLLGGLRDMSTAAENQRDLNRSRMGMVNSLLSGLYR